ncbi:universal stress protein [Desulfonema ishimotonii]|uniref:Universal stress protein n=1 Tax=Desulfonema ishimotonii TaxID=45657 RepID=A0A401G0V2_9BACT|nr:universal stress protein [Desulfonema ishimotonii]GBC62841.1 universal stress protein [Desulfonema ishimotonii]
MGHRILIAFDDSENAMRSVDHVANLFPPDSRVTVFSVLQDTANLCDMQSPELSAYFISQRSSFCTLEEKKKSLVRDAQEQAKEKLLGAGFRAENIDLRTQVRKKGIARDIVKEAESGYDVIVIGRRGLSGIKEFFMGSVSQKVLSLAKEMSVLLVG